MKKTAFILTACLLASVIAAPVSAEDTTTVNSQKSDEQSLSGQDPYVQSEFICGDVNCDGTVQLDDLTMISLSVLKDITLSDQQKKAADVNGDNEVDISDLALMKQYIMHDIVTLGKQPDKIVDITDEVKTKKLLSNTSMHSYNMYSPEDRRVTIIKSANDSTAEKFKEVFGIEYEKICIGLGVTSDSFNDNYLCIISYAEDKENLYNRIERLYIDEDNKLTVELSSVPQIYDVDDVSIPNGAVGGTLNGQTTGVHLALSIPKKYLKNIDTFTFNVVQISELKPIDIEKCNVLSYRCYWDSNVTDNKKSAIIKSTGELDKYMQQFSQSTVDEFKKQSKELNISDELFKDNTMVIANLQYGSGSYTDKISRLGINENNHIFFEIVSTLPSLVQCDIVQYEYAVIIPDKYLENTDLSELDFSNVIYRFFTYS